MSTDRSLATLLRALQSPSASPDDAGRLLSSATTLLTLLTNPLNLSLLTSHLLTAPAIWSSPIPSASDVRKSLQVLTTFHTAANYILNRENQPSPTANGFLAAEGLPREDWTRAVVKGADNRSERWKHLLVLGGILTGFESHDRHGLSLKLRQSLEDAVVTATNLSLGAEGEIFQRPRSLRAGAPESPPRLQTGQLTVIVVLAHSFDLLSQSDKAALDTACLLPALVQGMYFSREGLHSGYFLGTMDADVVQDSQAKFNWSAKSTSFHQAQALATGPVVSALGSLSRLAAFCVEATPNIGLVMRVLDDLAVFARSLSVQWRQNKLSELDASEEGDFLADEALNHTLPMLWQILKSAVFSIVVIQSGIITRVLRDPQMPTVQKSSLAAQSLHILRHMYFVSSRLGHNSFSQFNFVFNAALDILSKNPVETETFLREICPKVLGTIPEHPHDRCSDLFFLNAAEYLPLNVSSELSEELFLNAATPYLGTGGDARLSEIFEAAHSVFLAVFSAPQNFELTTRRLPSYIDTLFQVFPSSLSPRQFRLAIKTVVRIVSPPSRISETQPVLAAVLLEMVRHRALTSAAHAPLPPFPSQQGEMHVLSEQAALILAIIDALPYLSLPNLEEWLPLAAQALQSIRDEPMRKECQKRFWDVLSRGEMDPAKAQFCVTWWYTRGGRDFVLEGIDPTRPADDGPFMSGALGEEAKL